MNEIDYDRIEKIATNAAKNAQHSIVTETVTEVLKAHGIHSPQEMQDLMVYGRACMRNKQNMSRGFWGSVGGHAATVIFTLGAFWAVMKTGLGG